MIKDGIEDMQLSQVSFRQMPATLKVLLALAVSALVVTSPGCGTTTETPLPSLVPPGSSSLTQEQQKLAIQELNKKKATHEQDAIRYIEQSR
jgi:hypothetical protein